MTFDLTQLESKVSEIKQWLGSLSGELQNESYEINEFTVSYLYHLCQVCVHCSVLSCLLLRFLFSYF